MKKLILMFMVLAAEASAQTIAKSFTTFTATGVSSTLVLQQFTPVNHTVAVIVTGSPSSCTVALEGSLDAINWFSLSGDITCTASSMTHVVFRPVVYMRANLSVFSGGSSPTVAVRYLGVK